MKTRKTFRELLVGDYIYFGRYTNSSFNFFVVDTFVINSISTYANYRKYDLSIVISQIFEQGFEHQIYVDNDRLDQPNMGNFFFTENDEEFLEKMSFLQKVETMSTHNLSTRLSLRRRSSKKVSQSILYR